MMAIATAMSLAIQNCSRNSKSEGLLINRQDMPSEGVTSTIDARVDGSTKLKVDEEGAVWWDENDPVIGPAVDLAGHDTSVLVLDYDPLLVEGGPGTFSWLDISVTGEPNDGCELEILGKIATPEGVFPSSDWHSWSFLDRGDGSPPDAEWLPSDKFWIQFKVGGVTKLLLHADGTVLAATDCDAVLGSETEKEAP